MGTGQDERLLWVHVRLRSFVEQPLVDVEEIENRQACHRGTEQQSDGS